MHRLQNTVWPTVKANVIPGWARKLITVVQLESLTETPFNWELEATIDIY